MLKDPSRALKALKGLIWFMVAWPYAYRASPIAAHTAVVKAGETIEHDVETTIKSPRRRSRRSRVVGALEALEGPGKPPQPLRAPKALTLEGFRFQGH